MTSNTQLSHAQTESHIQSNIDTTKTQQQSVSTTPNSTKSALMLDDPVFQEVGKLLRKAKKQTTTKGLQSSVEEQHSIKLGTCNSYSTNPY